MASDVSVTQFHEPRFIVMPALDIQSGRAVRLTQGVVDTQPYAPAVEVARELIAAGARWLHVVDLDLARATGDNNEVVAAVVAVAQSTGVRVQVSGGIRDGESLTRALDAGAQRVNIACEALLDREQLQTMLQEHGARISVSLDVRGEELLARGTSIACGGLADALNWLVDAGVSRLVVTDVDADGAMSGPNLALVDRVTATGIEVVASGGIATLADVRTLAARQNQGVVGAIIGKAFYVGSFTVADAQEVSS